MKRLAIAISLYQLFAVSVVGQEVSITVPEFHRMVTAGMKASLRAPFYRYTERLPGKERRFEMDGRRSIRTSIINTESGEILSKCVVIADRIYERTANGHWTVRTREEYDTAQKIRSTAIRDAFSKRDMASYDKLIGAAINEAASLANSPDYGFGLIGIFADFTADAVIKFVGETTDKGRVLRRYTYRGSTDGVASPTNKLRLLRIHISYGFDKTTGALLELRRRDDWVYESKTTTHTYQYDWEHDPSIVITEPVIAKPKHQL